MTREKLRTLSCLKEIWIGLFDEENIQCKDADDEYQGLLMLLEIALSRGKSLSFSNYNLKASNGRILSELEWKTQECNKLKIEVHRLENSTCEKCSTLEAEMKSLKKKATEAQSRMKSIANILKLGDNIEESQSPRKNSALTLVSQMLLEDSPRRKKRCLPKTLNVWKETEINKEDDIANCTTLIPEHLKLHHQKSLPPDNKVDKLELIMSPSDLPTSSKDRTSKTLLTISLPTLNKDSPKGAKRNLISNFEKKPVESPQGSIKIIPETEQTELNSSLAAYVRESNSELDRIWFAASSSKTTEKTVNHIENETLLKPDTIIDSTPERTPKKMKCFWKMKEVRGPSEYAGSKKVRQTTLSLGHKSKGKDVDLSRLSGFDGGSLEDEKEDKRSETSSTKNRSPLKERDNIDSQSCLDIGEIDTNAFKPKATSTQNPDFDLVTSKGKSGDSPNYRYKRDAVKKKSERAKLDGWDCQKCAEYYAACGETSPSKLKSRMNKCSRHRDKFKPVSNTPPGFWNPIIPDTEECKEQGMYTSYNCKRGDL